MTWRTKLNSLYKKIWEVRRQVMRLVAPWVILLLIFAWMQYHYSFEKRLLPYYAQLNESMHLASAAFNRNVAFLAHDVRFLANHPAVQALDFDQEDTDPTQFSQFLAGFGSASGVYDQIRWLDVDGYEKLRVEQQQGQMHIVPKNALQYKGDRYYVREANQLSQGEVYFSAIDLNVERGQIETPYKPMLRIVTNIYDGQGNKKGMIVLNFLAQRLIDDLIHTQKTGIDLLLTQTDGFNLLDQNPESAWGPQLGHLEHSLAQRIPDTWRKLRSQTSGQFIDRNGMWQFQHILLLQGLGNAPQLTLINHIPVSFISRLKQESLLQTLGIALLLWLLVLVINIRIALTERARDKANQTLRHTNEILGKTITQLQETQKELIEAEKLSSLGMMVAGVAHEMNTPIGSALVTITTLQEATATFAQKMQTGLRRSEMESFIQRTEEGEAIILANLQRAANLITSFKQLAIDRAVTEYRTFKLTELIDDLQRTVWSRLKKQNHKLLIRIPPDLVLHNCPGSLGQVLENLVANALMHAFDQIPSGKITLSAIPQKKHVLIKVEDDGQGIDAELLPRIFDPFVTTKRGQGGTGLGLHITHQLVTQVLDGAISVESHVNIGTCFTLKLPLEKKDNQK